MKPRALFPKDRGHLAAAVYLRSMFPARLSTSTQYSHTRIPKITLPFIRSFSGASATRRLPVRVSGRSSTLRASAFCTFCCTKQPRWTTTTAAATTTLASLRSLSSFSPTKPAKPTNAISPSKINNPPSSSFSSSSPLLSSSNTTAVNSRVTSDRAALISRHFSSSSTASAPSTNPTMTYTVRNVGQTNTLEYRCYIEKDGVPISPFHDIPLYANEQQTVLNMIVEIPRWSNAKQEISKEEFLNPIKQDVKKGKLRYVRNCFPHKGYLWNYGAFPRTWEDPNSIHPETKAKGDDDPLDVCEIGELVGYTGQIKQVKILGVMALLDEEETDWKIIVIDINDPLAPKLNDVEDVERHLPGLLRATNEWFRIYKIPDGKPENQFAFSGECKNKKYATEVVHECADAWEKLVSGRLPRGEISLANVTNEQSADRVDQNQLAAIPKGENLPPAPIDGTVDKWFFISGAAV